jgi:hypothetical protein
MGGGRRQAPQEEYYEDDYGDDDYYGDEDQGYQPQQQTRGTRQAPQQHYEPRQTFRAPQGYSQQQPATAGLRWRRRWRWWWRPTPSSLHGRHLGPAQPLPLTVFSFLPTNCFERSLRTKT